MLSESQSFAAYKGFLAVVIATCNRPALLANRSLLSVRAQTRPPDLVIIVDDSQWRTRRINRDIAASWRAPKTSVTYLENWRTPGAAGAWNTAFHYLHRQKLPECWVALLDDDDEWLPEYLDKCLATGESEKADLVVAGLLRRTAVGPDYAHAVPDKEFSKTDFLIGNPHWQGSNTFARLSALIAAGGFDESFESTNDRDLGIRLLDLGYLKWSFVKEYLVIHYADQRSDRLSTKASPQKRAGIEAFYQKYCGRMASETSTAFFERAGHIFDVNDGQILSAAKLNTDITVQFSNKTLPEILVATISSPQIEITLGFLDEVRALAKRNVQTKTDLVILDNSGDKDSSRKLSQKTKELESEKGLRCFLLPQVAEGRLSITEARTILQQNCYRILNGRKIPVWLLDDDVRFDIPTDKGDHVDWNLVPNHLGWIADLSGTGADVVIGSVVGDPPLPFASTVRTQVVDLLHNLEWFSGLVRARNGSRATNQIHLKLNQELTSRHAENMMLRERYRDYYYDLSRVDTGHLERPFWYVPKNKGTTVGDAFKEMVASLSGIFAGSQVFRPLIWTPANPESNLLPGFNRGPNTLVFRPECLIEIPNAAPVLAGHYTRRSDMNWALLGSHINGWKVVTAPFPVRQDRSLLKTINPPEDSILIHDIRGYAVFSALSDIMLERHATQQLSNPVDLDIDSLSYSASEISSMLNKTEKYIAERLVAWETNYLRIKALAYALDSYIRSPKTSVRNMSYFWLIDPSFQPEVEHLSSFVKRLKDAYKPPENEVSRAVMAFDRFDLKQFYVQLGENIKRFKR